MADDTLELLRAINANLTEFRSELGTVLDGHSRALTVLQQDTGFVRNTVTGHSRTLDILLEDVRLLRGAVNDVAKENVTPGEVEAIHHDLNRLQQQVSELVARLTQVEARNHH